MIPAAGRMQRSSKRSTESLPIKQDSKSALNAVDREPKIPEVCKAPCMSRPGSATVRGSQ
jgi:hypothetical protein